MTRLIWLMAILVPASAWAQLYLIAGAIPPNGWRLSYAATLVRIEGDGVKPVAELVSKDPGVGLIAISHEMRKAVIVSEYVVVVDLDSAIVEKQCMMAQSRGNNQWLANVPGRGFMLEWDSVKGVEDPGVAGMLLDPSVPCEKSFLSSSLSDIKYAKAHGASGVGDFVAFGGIRVDVDKNGRLEFKRPFGIDRDGHSIFSMAPAYLDVAELPAEVRGIAKLNAVIATNSRMLLLGVGDGESHRVLVFKKRDRSWHTIPFPGDGWNGREFGEFIAITETREKQAIREQRQAHSGVINIDDDVMKREQSAGEKEWRGAEADNGPDQKENFGNSVGLYPGRLHLYNIETERLHTIVTNQGDSEILLVNNGIVYYRVSDRLYSASITEKGIGAAKLIATDDIIRDSHWAFIKH